VPHEIHYIKDENDPAKGKAIQAVRVIPDLEADKVEFDTDGRRDYEEIEKVLSQDAEQNDQSHTGNPDVLEIDTEDGAAKVRAGPGAYAVKDLEPYGNAGKDNAYDAPVLPDVAHDTVRPVFDSPHS